LADNRFEGAGGADTLDGGLGSDTLKGGAGADVFAFNGDYTALVDTNIDTIVDFKHGEDKIQLNRKMFSGIGPTLDDHEFIAQAKGHESDYRELIIYDKSNGTLWFDYDDSGRGAAVQFAVLDNKPQSLSYTDFTVV
jgi:Ca2+-binding RTX toxin-like protein